MANKVKIDNKELKGLSPLEIRESYLNKTPISVSDEELKRRVMEEFNIKKENDINSKFIKTRTAYDKRKLQKIERSETPRRGNNARKKKIKSKQTELLIEMINSRKAIDEIEFNPYELEMGK